jgi:hypothetical protein
MNPSPGKKREDRETDTLPKEPNQPSLFDWVEIVIGRLWHHVAVCAAVFLLVDAAASAAPAETPQVVINIFPEETRGPISPFLFGAGIDHKTNPMRYCRYPAQVEKDIRESGLRIARYPGGFVFARDDHRGSWKNFYWQDQIGKNPERNPLYAYDLDTFVQMCERFGIEPLMQINFVGETEASLRGYIEYLVGEGDIDGDGIDWTAKRAANGRIAPYRIRYWQLGNEVHDFSQGFHANAQGAAEYAAAVNRLVPLIREMTPEARIVVPFINIERPRSGMFATTTTPGLPDINLASGAEFARAFLAQLRVRIDYLDWHFYPANGWDGSYPFLGTDDEWKHYYCWGTKFRECYAQVVELMSRAHAQEGTLPRIIVGEWAGDITGMIFPTKENSDRGSMARTMASAVYMADILLFMMEHSVPSGHIHAAFWHNLGNCVQELFSVQVLPDYRRKLAGHIPWKGSPDDPGYWPTWPVETPCGMGFTVAGDGDPHSLRMPVYWVFKLLSEQRGDDLVNSRCEAPGNRIAAPPQGLYWDPEYHFERVVHCATRRGDDLYLAILNKDANQAVNLRAAVHGWRVASAAQVYTVGASSYLAKNTLAEPTRVTLAGPSEKILTTPGKIQLLLPPSTLMVVRFSRLRK